MQITLKHLPKSQSELTIELTYDELKPYLESAAAALTTVNPIAGFRPGKTPYEVAKQKLGEMNILETALERIIAKTFFQAIKEKKIDTIGPPKIDLEKSAPGNPLIYKATVAILPEIKLADWKSLKLSRRPKEVKDEQVEKVIHDVRKMRSKEAAVDRAAGKADKVVVDMDISLDKVPVEGGQAKDHAILLSEDYYIPGLADKLINLKKSDIAEFKLPFPKEHYQKHLAGKNAEFKITVKEVFEITPPDLNDEFAQSLGQPDMAALRKLVRENLLAEAGQKEDQRVEIEMLNALVKQSQFGELPDLIIDEEKHKMFAELKASLQDRGLSFEDYLKNIKKTEEELARGFTVGAAERAKTSLLMRQIAKEENITVTPEELADEITRLRVLYKEDPEIDKKLERHEMQDYVASVLLNRKVLRVLKERLIT